MQTTCGTNREVTPHIRTRAEVKLLQRPRGRLKSSIGILSYDTHSDDVALWVYAGETSILIVSNLISKLAFELMQ